MSKQGTPPRRRVVLCVTSWLFVLIALLAIITVALFALVGWKMEPVPPTTSCDSADCRFHRELITSRLNRSLDPCDDFAAFACSAWSPPPASLHRQFPSALDDVVLRWAEDFGGILDAGAREIPTGEKAQAMFGACLRGPSGKSSAQSLQELRRFMADRGIPWPAKSDAERATPLGVLLDLAFNWNLPLWFTVRFSRRSAGGDPMAIIIEPGPYALVWHGLHGDIVERGEFYHHWSRLYAALSDAGNAPTGGHRERAEREAQLDTRVLSELANAQLDLAARISDDLQLLDVDTKYTPHIEYAEWRSKLVKHVVPIIESDALLRLSNAALLTAVETLFALHDAHALLEHTGWFVARLLGPLADASLLHDGRGPSGTEQQLERWFFCAAHVEAIFRPLVISLYAAPPRFPLQRREHVNQLLRAVQETAASKMAALHWLDKKSRERARNKLNKTRTVLWPADNLLDGPGLSLMYAAFTGPRNWSFATWVNNTRFLRFLRHHSEYSKALRLPGNLVLPLLQYDYLSNEVRVSAQALSRPVYYAEGTLGMLYGGLGFMYASALVKALDADGSRRNEEGRLDVNRSWMSRVWTDAIADSEGCLQEPEGYLPEIPALEIAYASLEKALEASGKRLRTAHAEFSERRLFFITLCYLLCVGSTSNYTALGGDCNKAVANFPRFAQDFKCTQNDKMRRERACVFFV